MGTKEGRTKEGRFSEGNAAATRHGLRATLCLSRLPKGAGGIRKRLNALARELAAKVREVRGREPTGQEREQIQLAQHAEKRRLLADWYLRRSCDAGTMVGETFVGLLRIGDAALEERLRLERELLRPVSPTLSLPGFLNGERPGQEAPGRGRAGEAGLTTGFLSDTADAILGAVLGAEDRGAELRDK
jgi:hypothetical protein